MGTAPFEVKPLSPDRLPDFMAFFEGEAFSDNPKWSSCYCQCFYEDHSKVLWADRTAGENRVCASRRINTGEMQGLLAYRGQSGRVVQRGTTKAAPLTRRRTHSRVGVGGHHHVLPCRTKPPWPGHRHSVVGGRVPKVAGSRPPVRRSEPPAERKERWRKPFRAPQHVSRGWVHGSPKRRRRKRMGRKRTLIHAMAAESTTASLAIERSCLKTLRALCAPADTER